MWCYLINLICMLWRYEIILFCSRSSNCWIFHFIAIIQYSLTAILDMARVYNWDVRRRQANKPNPSSWSSFTLLCVMLSFVHSDFLIKGIFYIKGNEQISTNKPADGHSHRIVLCVIFVCICTIYIRKIHPVLAICPCNCKWIYLT